MQDKFTSLLSKRPGLKYFFNYPGTFNNYSQDLIKHIKPVNAENLVIKSIIKNATSLLGNRVDGEKLKEQLINYPLISYADHHGLLNHKLLYNSNILYSEIIRNIELPYMVVLATGNVPLINETYPKGIFFKNSKFNFFPSKENNKSVYTLDKKINVQPGNSINSFFASYDKTILTDEEKEFLNYIFFKELKISEASGDYQSFAEQITFLNFRLWKKYFDTTIRAKVPDLIYIQSNEVIKDILLDEISREDSLVSQILFEKDIRNLYLKNFNNIQGCWAENRGTHFFWGISESKRFTRLQYNQKENSLEGKGYNISLSRNEIIDHINNKKIAPSLFFDYLILSFIGEFTVMGGFNQIDYLNSMKSAHIKTLKELNLNNLADKFSNSYTNGLICGFMPIKHDSGIDLIWDYNSTGNNFNGNLNRGLDQEELNKINSLPIKKMIELATEAMTKVI